MRNHVIKAAVFILLTGCCQNKQDQLIETNNMKQENAIYPLGIKMPENFTGIVHYLPIVNPDDVEGLYSVGQVSFSPGARTHWHTHPAGQVLIVTGGKGWYQVRGDEPLVLKKGVTIVIPKDVEHWHGASVDEEMVHIAISNYSDGSNVAWMEPVTEEEYIK